MSAIGYVTVHLKHGEPVLVQGTLSSRAVEEWLEGSRTAQWLVVSVTVGGIIAHIPWDNVARIDHGPHYTH
jgi:hypothetical protein